MSRRGASWFKHSTTVREDTPVLQLLLKEWGAEGYGIYMMLKEKIAGSGGFVAEDTPMARYLWSDEFHTDEDTLDGVIEFLYSYQLLVTVDDGVYAAELDEDLSHLRKSRARQEKYRSKEEEKKEKQNVRKKKSRATDKPTAKADSPMKRIIEHNAAEAEKALGFRPSIAWHIVGPLIKQRLAQFSEDEVKAVISEAYQNDFMRKFKLTDITKILSAKHFNMMLAEVKKADVQRADSDTWRELETEIDIEDPIEAII